MEAREKAAILFDKFEAYEFDGESISLELAIKCVDEIILELTEQVSPSLHGFRHNYWREVKKHLEEML